jgi:Bacteriophage holin of superfamily 6 (Holin_LLH)
MSFLNKILDEIKIIGAATAHAFANAYHKLLGSDLAKQFAHDALDILKTDLGAIALEVVNNLKDLAISGAEKRQQAFVQIKSDATAKGITAADSIINLFIELAVAALKGGFLPIP